MADAPPALAPPPPVVPAVDTLEPPPRRRRTRHKRSGPLRRSWRRLRRPLLWASVVVGAFAALFAVDAIVRYLPAMRALAHGRDVALQAEILVSTDLAHLDATRLQQARDLLANANADFGERSSIIENGWTGSLIEHLPIAGRHVRATRALRAAGAAGTSLGLDLMPLLQEVVPDPHRAPLPTLARVSKAAREQQAALTTARQHLGDLSQAVASVPDGWLLGPLDSARQTVLRAGPRVENGAGPAISFLQNVPLAVGAGTHSYLILFENPTEQRPSGGFIGAVGEVVFTEGVLTSATFEDPAVLNAGIHSVPVPGPLDQHLFRGHPLEFGDANWDADFPAAASQMGRLYTMATGHHTDGVIGVDPIALGYVLALRGPVTVPPYPQTITAGNVLLELDYIANRVRPTDPGKVFLPPFGRAMLDALIGSPPSQLPSLAEALQRGAREKHIVMNFNDPSLQRMVDSAGFGGRIDDPLADALLVDDANLSGTKGDLTVARDFTLAATVAPDGEVHDHLVLHYRNPAPPDALMAKLEVGSGGAYRDYVRVYVPETAQLDRMTLATNGEKAATVAPEAVQWEYQREAIAFWLIVPKGGESTLTLDYSGPFADASRGPVRYSVLWQKQVNALTWPVTMSAQLPQGGASLSTDLETDRRWDPSAR